MCDYMLSINTKRFMLTCNLLDTMYHLSLLRNLFMLMLYHKNIEVCNVRQLVLCKNFGERVSFSVQRYNNHGIIFAMFVVFSFKANAFVMLPICCGKIM